MKKMKERDKNTHIHTDQFNTWNETQQNTVKNLQFKNMIPFFVFIFYIY